MTAEQAPWSWEHLSSEEFAGRMHELADWVERMLDEHAAWLQLPPCWPLHVAVRKELATFMYWERFVERKAPHPSQGAQWFREFRSAAEAWRRIASCRHESPVRYQAALRDRDHAASAAFLEQAIRDHRR